MSVDLAGAAGGDLDGPAYYGTGYEGKGGRVQATLSVTAGSTLNLFVGGQGQSAVECPLCTPGVGGWNGGGGQNLPGAVEGGGGGATDIRIGGTDLAHRVIVGGGGGGAALGDNVEYHSLASLVGGMGGGLVGGDGTYDLTWPQSATEVGRGGSQSAGGAAGCNALDGCVGAGSLGQGGNTNDAHYNAGGGGGGGYYGGGGGLNASGGGGSSYCDGVTCFSPTHTQGYENGDGYVNPDLHALRLSGSPRRHAQQDTLARVGQALGVAHARKVEREDGRRHPILDAQLHVDRLQVAAHRVRAQVQQLGDLVVRLAEHRQWSTSHSRGVKLASANTSGDSGVSCAAVTAMASRRPFERCGCKLAISAFSSSSKGLPSRRKPTNTVVSGPVGTWMEPARST